MVADLAAPSARRAPRVVLVKALDPPPTSPFAFRRHVPVEVVVIAKQVDDFEDEVAIGCRCFEEIDRRAEHHCAATAEFDAAPKGPFVVLLAMLVVLVGLGHSAACLPQTQEGCR